MEQNFLTHNMEFTETIMCRYELDEDMLCLLAFIYSDEYLSTSFVFKQLQVWIVDPNYLLVCMCSPDTNFEELIKVVRSKVSVDLFKKMREQIDEKDVHKQDRIVCSLCHNYGSIVSSRRICSTIRFVCEKCQETKEIGTQSISQALWSRRCNELSNNQLNSHLKEMKKIRSDLFDFVGNLFDVIPSIMILKKNYTTNILTLSALFSMRKFRKNGHGKRLIQFIPSIPFTGTTFSISICTAELESEYLFSKCKK